MHSAWLIANLNYVMGMRKACFLAPGRARGSGGWALQWTKVRAQAGKGHCRPDCGIYGLGQRVQGPEGQPRTLKN